MSKMASSLPVALLLSLNRDAELHLVFQVLESPQAK